MIKVQDFGEVAYGVGVTFAEWWDNKRIKEGTLAKKELWKKASFYTYLGVGLPATLMSAFGWWRRGERWTEHLSIGFLYDFPRFILGVVQSMSAGSKGTRSDAVREAQEIIRRKAEQESKLLASGRSAERSYQPEFESVAPHAF